ncbi:MAG TPA: hypothetical protein DCL06_06285 [Corynebacterium variabile]|uniref:DNA-binding protein n=1 Tax=Corynebacterium variabile TaxID=1727 RepID=A0A3B9QUB7_9CORY|nr:hypothetical protein [Corynebacterium variabile]
MTTEPEIRGILDDLHALTKTMCIDLHDSALPAASGSGNGGKAPKRGRSRLPVSADDLDFHRENVWAVLEPVAKNLAGDLNIGGLPVGEEPPAWVDWLTRHRVDLIARPWWPDVEPEIIGLRRLLLDTVHPPEPTRPKLPDFATADEIGRVTGRTTDAIRRWCKKNGVECFTIGGVKHYRTRDVL